MYGEKKESGEVEGKGASAPTTHLGNDPQAVDPHTVVRTYHCHHYETPEGNDRDLDERNDGPYLAGLIGRVSVVDVG